MCLDASRTFLDYVVVHNYMFSICKSYFLGTQANTIPDICHCKIFELEHKRIALHSKYWNNYETKNWEMAVIFDLMEIGWIGISTRMAEAIF